MKTAACCLCFVIAYSPMVFGQVDQFRSLEYRYTGGRYDNFPFQYRLFVATENLRGHRYPLVIWLHGYGEFGRDNKSQLAWVYSFMRFDSLERFPYFVLAMQCPEDNAYWVQNNDGPTAPLVDDNSDEMLAVLQDVVDKTIAKYAIDTNRIYLVGICSGGDGCWEMAMRNPTRYAAMATLADYGREDDRLQELIDIPIWSFHSAGDSPEGIRRMFSDLKSLGGQCHLTETPSNRHDCWTTANEDYILQEWLFSHDLTNDTGRKPGALTWNSAWNVMRRDYLCLEFFFTSILGPSILLLYVVVCLSQLRSQFQKTVYSTCRNEDSV